MSVSDGQHTGQWHHEIILLSDVITISVCATTKCEVHTKMESPVDGVKCALSLSNAHLCLAFQRHLGVDIKTRTHGPAYHTCDRSLAPQQALRPLHGRETAGMALVPWGPFLSRPPHSITPIGW